MLNAKTNDIDMDNLIYYLTLKRFEFDNSFLKTHREILTKSVVDSIRKENEMNLKLKNEILCNSIKKEEKCNLDYPVCTNDANKDFQRTVNSFIVLRSKSTDNLIVDDYFCGVSNNSLVNSVKEVQQNDSKDILIERRNHTCRMSREVDSNKNNYKFDKITEEEKYSNNVIKKRGKCKILLLICISTALIYFHRFQKSINDSVKVKEFIEYANVYEKIKTGTIFIIYLSLIDEDFLITNKLLSKFTPKPLKNNEY